jgi:class 3 adenylate cyclase/tetratricopeptide (TPR) repeat protein
MSEQSARNRPCGNIAALSGNRFSKRISRYLPSHLSESLSDPAVHSQVETHLLALLRTVMTYLPRRLLRNLLAEPTPGRVWGESVEGTLLFADLSGFTSLAASLSQLGRTGAEQLVAIVNAIFAAMLEIIHEEGGDLLVFGGDALSVLFSGGRHAASAVRTAVQLQQAMVDFASVETNVGTFSLTTHIGVNSGRFLAASVGQLQAMQYVLLGRAVEMTAQAEALAGPGETVVGESTAQLVPAISSWQSLEGPWYRLPSGSVLPSPDHKEPPPELSEGDDILSVLDTMVPYLPAGLLERLVPYPAEPTVEADLKPVAVLFANLLGFETLLDALGPKGLDSAIGLLQRYMTAMQRVVERYEGTLNKMDLSQRGGKLLVLFGAPIKHEDDPARAVRAALDMQREVAALSPVLADYGDFSLQQRIGLHVGDVFAGNVGSSQRKEYTVMGTPVNLAARVMAAATPDQVWATGALHERVEANARTAQPLEIQVKGWADPLQVYQVLGLQLTRRQGPFHPLVGREKERGLLLQAIKGTQQGQGQLVSLVGEAGVGKSRLVEEAVALAEQWGLQVLLAHTPSYGERVPYTPWAELLRDLLGWTVEMTLEERAERLCQQLAELSSDMEPWAPVIAEPLGLSLPDTPVTAGLAPRLRQQRFFDLTLQILQAEAAEIPLLLILEDFHWAGPLASELLAYLGRNIVNSPVMILPSYRPGTTTFPWEGLSHHQEIRLSPLPEDQSRALAVALTGSKKVEPALVHLVWERSLGNPLFAEEILQALREQGVLSWQEGDLQLRGDLDQARQEIPLSVQEVILSRIDRLREEVRSVLRVASVIDQEFTFPVLAGVYPYEEPEAILQGRVKHLCQSGMLMETSPEEYAFRHALTREVAYHSILQARRQTLHEQVGDFYEEHFVDRLEQYYGFLAYHYGASTDLAKGLEYAVKAGRQAAHAYANEAAAEYFQQVLAIAESMPHLLAPRERIQILRERGDVLWQAGHFSEALASFEKALQGGRVVLSNAEIAELYRLSSNVHERSGRYEESLNALQKAHRVLLRSPEGMSSLERARVLAAMSGVYMRRGSYQEAARFGDEALVIAEKVPEGRDRSSLLGRMHEQQGNVALMMGQYQDALRDFERALYFHKEADERQRIAIVYNNMGYVWHFQDAYQQEIDSYLQCLEVAQQIGDPYVAAYAANNLGSAWYELGDYDLAMSYCQESLAVRERIGDQAGMASCWDTIGLIHAARGEYVEALRLHRDSLDLKRILRDRHQEANSLINIAQTHRSRGEFQAALSLGREALQLLEELGTQAWLDEAHFTVAEALLAMGRVQEARQHAEAAQQIAASTGGRKHGAIAARVLAEVLAADLSVQSIQVEQLFEQSISTLADLNCRLEWARASCSFGRFLHSQGQLQRAQEQLEQARGLYREMGLAECED